SAECAVDSAAHDSVIAHTFPAGPDSVKLFGSRGGSTDSAQLVRGRFESDSLFYDTSSITRTASKGRWVYRDAASGARAILFGDSLAACEFLNQAESLRLGDSTLVR